MCGTSRGQIEKTYYHIDEDILTTQAMAGYYTIDGMIIPKQYFNYTCRDQEEGFVNYYKKW